MGRENWLPFGSIAAFNVRPTLSGHIVSYYPFRPAGVPICLKSATFTSSFWRREFAR
jgi:hypothetical protein